jgi:hypothetical protein
MWIRIQIRIRICNTVRNTPGMPGQTLGNGQKIVLDYDFRLREGCFWNSVDSEFQMHFLAFVCSVYGTEQNTAELDREFRDLFKKKNFMYYKGQVQLQCIRICTSSRDDEMCQNTIAGCESDKGRDTTYK